MYPDPQAGGRFGGRDDIANALWSLDVQIREVNQRLQAVERQIATTDEKQDATIQRLDRINGAVGRHDATITALQVSQARSEGQLSGRDHVTAHMSARDRGYLMAVIGGAAALATLIGVVVTLVVGVWF